MEQVTEKRGAYLMRWIEKKGPVAVEVSPVPDAPPATLWLADATTFANPIVCHQDELAFSEAECRQKMLAHISREEEKLARAAAKLAKMRAIWEEE